MPAFLGAVGLAFGAIFVAEFGDKSQLLILAFAARHPARRVVLGMVLGAAVVQGISVAIGAAVGAVLPEAAVSMGAGLAFVAVAAWTLRPERDDAAEASGDSAIGQGRARLAGAGLVLAVAATFILGELGDKTMLATFALAATQGALPTWIGSTAGEVAANLVAVAIGRQVGDRLSPRAVRIGAATTFAVAGAVMLVRALLP